MGWIVERLRHLVVVLPGILGSALEDKTGRRLWGPGLAQMGRSLVRPGDLSLAENPELIPVGLLPTISIVPPVLRVPGYDRLVRMVGTAFAGAVVDTAHPDRPPVQDADVLLVPYDFRVGVEAAANYVREQVEKRLSPLHTSARRGRVIVVGHSMGGLVARHWLGPGGGAADCAALITVGTPHGGAPKALQYLVNGVGLGGRVFRNLTALTREWPSAYDLLPRYPAVAGADGTHLYPHDLAVLAPLGIADRVRSAYRAHLDIDEAWAALGEQPEVTALFARGHRTPLRAELVDGALSVSKADAEWLPNPGWFGDGTVPADAAIPNDLPERRSWLAVPQRHLQMASSPAIVDVLRNLAGNDTRFMRGDAPDQPWLGLDLDEIYMAHEPVEVGVELLGAAPAEDTAVWVTVDRRRFAADRRGDGWVARMPGLRWGGTRCESTR